jgi:hypothetical protein
MHAADGACALRNTHIWPVFPGLKQINCWVVQRYYYFDFKGSDVDEKLYASE